MGVDTECRTTRLRFVLVLDGTVTANDVRRLPCSIRMFVNGRWRARAAWVSSRGKGLVAWKGFSHLAWVQSLGLGSVAWSSGMIPRQNQTCHL